MKTTLSLLAVLAIAACANPESNDAPASDGMTMDAPKAATVSLNISGMT